MRRAMTAPKPSWCACSKPPHVPGERRARDAAAHGGGRRPHHPSTFRSMNEGIALFDPRGRPITMNRRVIDLVGVVGFGGKLPLRSS
ncbi:PAS domain-containing protein [Rhizobium leguminosarum]